MFPNFQVGRQNVNAVTDSRSESLPPVAQNISPTPLSPANNIPPPSSQAEAPHPASSGTPGENEGKLHLSSCLFCLTTVDAK